MVEQVTIKNYKSIKELNFEPGRVNIIIGANGVGKSNILEALLLAAAAYQSKLDDEFLANRGIRTSNSSSMKSGFDKNSQKQNIYIKLASPSEESKTEYIADLRRSAYPFEKWENKSVLTYILPSAGNLFNTDGTEEPDFTKKEDSNSTPEKNTSISKSKASLLMNLPGSLEIPKGTKFNNLLAKESQKSILEYLSSSVGNSNIEKVMKLSDFVVYYPDVKALNKRDRESNITPLGINGDGLLELIRIIQKKSADEYKGLIEYLNVFEWFKKIDIIDNGKQELPTGGEFRIYDRYLSDGLKYFDQRNVNEGFFFILLYYVLFTSKLTPKFFAIDNVDTSLNPRLCKKLMEDIVAFSKKYKKQSILTTHNPVLLDGLDLFDDSQRLFVAYRNADGETQLNRVKPLLPKDKVTIKNSEAFIRGHFGGLPDNF